MTPNAHFTAGVRAFRARLPCNPPAHLCGEDAETFEDGWWWACDEERGPELLPAFDPRQMQLFEVRP